MRNSVEIQKELEECQQTAVIYYAISKTDDAYNAAIAREVFIASDAKAEALRWVLGRDDKDYRKQLWAAGGRECLRE